MFSQISSAITRVTGVSNGGGEQSTKESTDVSLILQNPGSKEYTDLRDRAAYVYVVGSFPTHLRRYFVSLLGNITSYSRKPVSLDGLSGSVSLNEEMVHQLKLEEHPLVRRAKQYVEDGYTLQNAKSMKSRRPFGRVLLFKNTEQGTARRVTIHTDGSVNDGWT